MASQYTQTARHASVHEWPIPDHPRVQEHERSAQNSLIYPKKEDHVCPRTQVADL